MEKMDSHHHPNTIVRNGVITLENYLTFTDSHKTEDLTVNHLNQIVAMHGFTKLKASKKVIIDAVNTLDLMSLTRSSLKENISSSVPIKSEEVITDLNILNWQECTVTSIQHINPLDDSNSSHSQPICLQSSGQPKSIKANPNPKKKCKSISEVPSSSISEASTKAKPKPKRKYKSVPDVPSSSTSEASKSNSACTSGSGESVKKPKGESVEKRKSNKRKGLLNILW